MTFSKKSELKKHNAAVHVGKKSHKCSKCDGTFGSRFYLKKHMSVVHEGMKPYISQRQGLVCKEKSFRSRRRLKYRGYTISPTAEDPDINENDNGKLGFYPKIKVLHKTS